MNIRALAGLGLLLFTPQLSAQGPWTDSSYEIDKDAELAILRELVEMANKPYERCYELRAKGMRGGEADNFSLAGRHFFAANARLLWAQDEFVRSYRATKFAVMANQDAVASVEQSWQLGLVSANLLREVQNDLAQTKIIALRYETEARRRGVKLEPVTRDDYQQFVKQKFADFQKASNVQP